MPKKKANVVKKSTSKVSKKVGKKASKVAKKASSKKVSVKKAVSKVAKKKAKSESLKSSAKKVCKSSDKLPQVGVLERKNKPNVKKTADLKPSVVKASKKEQSSEKIALKKPKKKLTKAQIAQESAIKKLSSKWVTLQRRNRDEKAPKYNMKNKYAPKTPLLHSKLGWGYILENRNDRLEVLFECGVKFLISNYVR